MVSLPIHARDSDDFYSARAPSPAMIIPASGTCIWEAPELEVAEAAEADAADTELAEPEDEAAEPSLAGEAASREVDTLARDRLGVGLLAVMPV